MNFYSRAQFIREYVCGQETELIESYLENGPISTREMFAFTEGQWELVFDYLVFTHNLLFKCIVRNADFFVQQYVEHGMAHLRDMFGVCDMKYDEIWRVVFDFVAIANDGIYMHVLHHRDRYTLAMKARDKAFVRKVLGLWGEQYDESWARILDVLLNSAADAIFSETTYERGLERFSHIINGSRKHRAIVKHDLGKWYAPQDSNL